MNATEPMQLGQQWPELGEVEQWCADFAALLGPAAVPAEWIYILARRIRGSDTRAMLSSRNPEAEAAERLAEAGWISWTTDRPRRLQIDSDTGEWLVARLDASPGRKVACINAIATLALERARTVRRAADELRAESDAVQLLAVSRKLAELGRIETAMQVATAVALAAHEAGKAEQTAQLLSGLLAPIPEDQYRLRHVLALLNLGRMQYRQKAYTLARDTFERVISLATPNSLTVGFAHCDLGQALYGLGELDAAEREIRQSIALLRLHFPAEHPRLGAPYHELACVLSKQLKRDQAVEYFERAIQTQTGVDEDGKLVADSYLGIATARIKQNNFRGAVESARRALEFRQCRLPADHPKLTTFYNIMAIASRGSGDHTTAIECFKTVLAIKVRTLGEEHEQTLGTRTMLAKDLEAKRDFPEALACWEQIVAIRGRAHAHDAHHLAVAKNNLAVALNRVKRHPEALAQLDEAMAIHDRLLGPDDAGRVATYLNTAITLRNMNQTSRALALAVEAVRILKLQSPSDRARLRQAMSLVRGLELRPRRGD